MFYSTRSRLVISFLAVALLVCGVALLVGGRVLYHAVLNEATSRVRLDLNAAREIYEERGKRISIALNLTSMALLSHVDLDGNAVPPVVDRLTAIADRSDLDFLGVVTRDGKVLCRIGPNSAPRPDAPLNPLARLALNKRVEVSGAVALDANYLFSENPGLADRARIRLAEGSRGEETSGMALAAAVPIFESGAFLGVVYGGILLNNTDEIVDRVRDTVFQHETYEGRSIGTATIFLNDVRIATNVLTPEGARAVGTTASLDVAHSVLREGRKWTDRAFVVNDWYITAYEPIVDVFGQRIGMLYVGVLEAKYAEVRSNAFSLFILITLAGMALAVGLGCLIANRISRPVKGLIEASAQVSQGNLSPEIGPISKSEIGVLQNTFGEMLNSLRERDERQKADLIQFEKQASIGKLAGGVAHEINNPLTGIFTFTHMLLRKNLPEEVRSDIETIAEQTERVRKIVKGLLDFSRQTELDRELTDVNRLVRTTLALVENQALIKGVTLAFEKGDGLPPIELDRNQMQSVLLNMVINALDATGAGGRITVSTGIGLSANQPGVRGVEIICSDTGCGIAPENLNRIFDPFFTTKDVGSGTGLGLSVSYGIVERHGGFIWAQSRVGRGSAFTVWLPINRTDEQGASDASIGS